MNNLGFQGGSAGTGAGLVYKGVWDAFSNSPFLASSVGTDGDYYIVSVAGTTNLNGITDWNVGDWAIFNGGIWQKIDNSDTGGTVTSVGASAGTGISITGTNPITTTGIFTITNTKPDVDVVLASGTGISVTGLYPSFTITNTQPSAGGTVTSVGLSMPSAFTVSNSPITGSGSINVTGSGTTAQYIRGDGTLATFPTLTGYVPYTGATNNLDLGTFNLTADHISLNTNPSGAGFTTAGSTQWNNTDGTSETLLKGNSVILKNGVDLVVRVVNKTVPNTNLLRSNYQVVKISGATGGRLSVSLAQANIDDNSADTLGVVCEDISINQEGFIQTVGQLLDINTTGALQGEVWADGDVLYLSPTVPGKLTNVKPNGSTGHIVVIGYVEYTHPNNGKIYVKVMNGWELDELHNVFINNPQDKNILSYVTPANLWENRTLGQVIGGLPSQYVRGDGTVADFPTSGGSGGSVVYYLNGSIAQGTFGGNAYKQLSKVPIIGAGTDFNISANGFIARFITDSNDPALLNIPGGAWNLGFFFSADSSGGTPSFYANIYKYDGSTFTLLGSNISNPEYITNGASIDAYYTNVAIPNSTLTLTDRIAIDVYVNNSGKTITLHTEGSHLCEVVTTFSTGITALNGLTSQVQYLGVGSAGTTFGIVSSGNTHTFNLPTASAINTGALSNADFITFSGKQNALNGTGFVKASGTTITYDNSTYLTSAITSLNGLTASTQIFANGFSSLTPTFSSVGSTHTLNIPLASTTSVTAGLISKTDYDTFNGKIGGSGTANYVSKFTASGTIGNSLIQDNGSTLGINGVVTASERVRIYGGNLPYGLSLNSAYTTDSSDSYALFGQQNGSRSLGTNTGVWGYANGSQQENVGVKGSSSSLSIGKSVGGSFTASNSAPGLAYSLKLSDGTENTGRFLKCVTIDGYANWSSISVADTGLTLTTSGTSGAASLVGNILNIPQYTGSTPVVNASSNVYNYNNFF